MKQENKVKIFNRLFFKLYLNYAIMIVLSAALIGFIFMKRYGEVVESDNNIELCNQAKMISTMSTDYIESSNKSDYLNYIDAIEKVNDWDIWTVSSPFAHNPMGRDMETGDSYNEFVSEKGYAQYVPLLKYAFNGKIRTYERYDDVYEENMVTVCAPINDAEGEVVGAVLVKGRSDVKKQLENTGFTIIIPSILLSLGISFAIVIVFATRLSVPITRMRATALELAAGNYNSKTGIERNDEIGDLAMTVDMLSDKLLENDIERNKLEQMRVDFFANVSHELRTPITVVRAYTETLADGVVKDEAKVKQYYNHMLSECKSMERLVGDLLILSKMQNPDFAIEKEPVCIEQIFDDIIRSAGAIAKKKNINIEILTDDTNSMMLGDYDRLRQMFMVILDNAIKFSEENKTVHIKIANEDKIIVSIQDEGVGIEASDIPNIFQKFYKSNLRQNASGTGLGLAIAKQIAIKHDGVILVNSTPGVGTEFIFTFPKLMMEEEE